MTYHLRLKFGAGAAGSTSYLLAFDQAAPLPKEAVILLGVRRSAGGSIDPGPTALPAAGAVLLPGSGATGGTTKTWSGLYAIRGGAGVNSVNIVGPAATTQALMVAYGGVTDADWAALVASSGFATTTQDDLALTVTTLAGVDDRPTIAVGLVVTGAGSGVATGYTFGAGWEKGGGGGGSTSSVIGWAERVVQASSTVPPLTAAWGGTPGVARLLGVTLRAGPMVAKVKDATGLPSHTVQGVWDAAAGKVRPLLHWGDGAGTTTPPPENPPTGTTRLATVDPWNALSPYRAPVALTATLSTTDDKAVRMRSLASEGTVNSAYYSVRRAITTTSTPVATITNLGVTPNVVYTDTRIPSNFEPPIAGPGGVADGNSFIIHPNGYTASEFFKLLPVLDGNGNRVPNQWTCRRRVDQDLRGDGIAKGVRANGNSMGVGLILKAEADAAHIPHAMSISMNEKDLKLNPTSADGQVVNGKAVWPANTQDTQVAPSASKPAGLVYSGPIPMGTWFVLPPSVNIDAATLLNGTPLSALQKAVCRAARDYGWTVTDRSAYANLYMEPECTSAQAAAVRLVWREVIIPNAARLTNQRSDNVGGGVATAARRQPLAPPFHSSIPPLD